MKVWNLSETQIYNALPDGLTFSVSGIRGQRVVTVWGRMIPSDPGKASKARYCRHNDDSVSPFGWERKGRWIRACCYHGFRDGISALFAHGATRVQSTMGDWTSLDAFTADLPKIKRDTQTVKNGMGMPLFTVSCNCREVEVSEATYSDGRMEFLSSKTINPLRCRFTILLGEHYRADGSCLCDDPEHRAMMIREWEYEPDQFDGIPLRQEYGRHICYDCGLIIRDGESFEHHARYDIHVACKGTEAGKGE